VINNFNFLETRNDVGALWENFVIVERLKFRHYHHLYASQYFWRTYDGSEVDLVEEREGKLYGYEFKWGKKIKATHKPLRWLEYPGSSFQYKTPNDLFGFVL
jgi:predicted AAA+ superfamily ATPase